MSNITRTDPKNEREYSRKCLQIVESLLEEAVTSELVTDFLDKCRYITANHYNDVCVERSLCDMCGYALCGNRLSARPTGALKTRFQSKQTFKIDAKRNRVYRKEDIHHFCSDLCLMASNYLRRQLSEEPIYMRTKETTNALKDIRLFDKDLLSKDVIDDLNPKPIDITAEKDTKRAKELVGYPYVTEDYLDLLKDQMKDLTIKEKLVSDGRESDTTSENSEQHISDNEVTHDLGHNYDE